MRERRVRRVRVTDQGEQIGVNVRASVYDFHFLSLLVQLHVLSCHLSCPLQSPWSGQRRLIEALCASLTIKQELTGLLLLVVGFAVRFILRGRFHCRSLGRL